MTTTRIISNTGSPLTRPDGTPLAFMQVSFLLSSMSGAPCDVFDAVTGERVVGSVSVVTDANGLFSAALWPNDRGSIASQYVCTINYPGATSFSAGVPSGSTPLTWLQFKTSGLPVTPQIVTALTAYIAQIDADVAAALDQANIATAEAAIATEKAALTAQDVTSTHADVVLTHSDVVLTHTDVVLTHEDVATTQGLATVASAAATDATGIAAAINAALASFRSKWIGSFATDPLLDGNGNALSVGAECFNTVSNTIRVYTASGWANPDAAALLDMTNAALSAIAAAGSASSANSFQQQAGMYAVAALAAQLAAANSATQSAASATQANTSAGTSQQYSNALAAIASQTAVVPVTSKTISPLAAVDSYTYDLKTDTDEGGWRSRTLSAKWRTEATTATGKNLGYAANETAARAISGATTGDCYFDTTAGLFKSLSAGSGTATVYRGSRQEMPDILGLSLHANFLAIWDLIDSSIPVWKVLPFGANYCLGTGTPYSVCAKQGIVIVSQAGQLTLLDFTKDKAEKVNSTGVYTFSGSLASGETGVWTLTNASPSYDNTFVSALLVIEPATPSDSVTGLPVPSVVFGCGNIQLLRLTTNTVTTIAAVPCSHYRNAAITQTGDTIVWNVYNSIPQSVKINNITTAGIVQFQFDDAIKQANYGAGSLKALSSSYAIQHMIYNSAVPNNSLLCLANTAACSGWIFGSTFGAWMNDTLSASVTATEKCPTVNFAGGNVGWLPINPAISTINTTGGTLNVVTTAAGTCGVYAPISVVKGQSYSLQGDFVSFSATATYRGFGIGTYAGSFDVLVAYPQVNTVIGEDFNFVSPITGTLYVGAMYQTTAAGATASFNNFSVKEVSANLASKYPAEPAKNGYMRIVGTLNRTAVASGAQLVAYSGFSTSNYGVVDTSTAANFEYGAAAFYINKEVFITATPTANETLIERAYFTAGAYSGAYFSLFVDTAGKLNMLVSDGTNSLTITSTAALLTGDYLNVLAGYDGTNFRLMSNGVDVATPVARGSIGSLNNLNASIYIGINAALTLPAPSMKMLQVTTGKYFFSNAQAAFVYATERTLLQPGTQCTIDGTGAALRMVSYDKKSGLTSVVTDWGVTEFDGIVRSGSAQSSVFNNGVNSVSRVGDYRILAGGLGIHIYKPSQILAEEMRRSTDQRLAFGEILEALDFDAASGQTVFPLPIGYHAKFVYVAGAIKRLGSTKDYTITADAYTESVKFTVGRAAAEWVSILCVRKPL